MSYQPWVGKLEDGTEVLVTITHGSMWDIRDIGLEEAVASVEVAFRAHRQHTWGPPVQLERAP